MVVVIYHPVPSREPKGVLTLRNRWMEFYLNSGRKYSFKSSGTLVALQFYSIWKCWLTRGFTMQRLIHLNPIDSRESCSSAWDLWSLDCPWTHCNRQESRYNVEILDAYESQWHSATTVLQHSKIEESLNFSSESNQEDSRSSWESSRQTGVPGIPLES